MDERSKIARWRTAGISVDFIAEKLGHHRSTIFLELRRNIVTANAVACEWRQIAQILVDQDITSPGG